MREMNDQEKNDILSMDEVMTFFLIDECSSFIWKMNHDLSHGKIEESSKPTVIEDIDQIASLQKFAVDNLTRFGLTIETLTEEKKEDSDLRIWYKHWSKWRTELTDEEWEKVSIGEYEEFLPKNKWNKE